MSNNETPALTSDHCREIAKQHGITLQSVGLEGAIRLHRILCRHVFASTLFNDTYSVDPIRNTDIYRESRKKAGRVIAIELHVSAFYFSRREAITFNTNGFIGFCGWADSTNSQPIYAAFVDWCKEISEAALTDINKQTAGAA